MPVTIYKIVNKVNSKVYVGQTTKPLNVRFSQHKYSAKRLNHSNLLANAFRKYGHENFSIEPVVVCEDSSANYYEDSVMSVLSSKAPVGYNIRKATYVDYNDTHTSAKGEQHGCAKLTEKDALHIINSLDKSTNDMCKEFNINRHTVSNLRSGKTWKHLDVMRHPPTPYKQDKLPSGEDHHASLLSDQDRESVETDSTTPTSILAEKFGVSSSVVLSIRGAQPNIKRTRKCTEDKAQYVLDNPEVPNKELSKFLGISQADVSRVKNGLMYSELTSSASVQQWDDYHKTKSKFSTKKLTEELATEIVNCFDKTSKELSIEYGISQDSITRIRSGRSWKNIPRPDNPKYV